MSCCGEKIRRPNLHNQYSHISPMMNWGPKNSYDLLEPFSKNKMESRNGKVETLPRNFPACDVKHAADFLLSILRTMLFPTI